jgi:predicted metal-dependent TIM-barrel fold hydrolase
LPWDEAKKVGHYLLDEHGALKEQVREIFHVVADTGVSVSFAHSTHPEIEAMAELSGKLALKRAFIDHPFSPFVDLSVDQMRWLTGQGIYVNFTYDEISPLLGVDPARMYAAIRAIGTDYVTLSSDCGEPLFPNSVEAMRQIRGYMRAFGLSNEEVDQVSVHNPAKLVGLN